MDDKKLVMESEYVLKNVACYAYNCGACPAREVIPQLIAKTFNKLAPEGWCCVAQDDKRTYYCRHCSKVIGIGV
jgi:hypothetical protein